MPASDAVTKLLVEATRALKQTEREQCFLYLTRARDVAIAAGDDDGLHQSCWFLARAHHDFGQPAGLAEALGMLLDRGFPFITDERQQTLHDWTFWLWDRHGYGSDAPVKLWEASAARKIAAGKTGEAVDDLALVAWQHAVTGNRAGVRGVVARWRALPPESEYDSSDAILFDSAFMAGVWAEDEALAREGRDVFLEFLARSGTAPESEHQFLRCAARAATLFGWKEDQARWLEPYREGLGGMQIEYEKQRMERMRADAIFALVAGHPEEALGHFRALAEHAEKKKIGPEYVAEGSVEAARCAIALGRHAEAVEDLKKAVLLVDRYRVTAFEAPIEKVYARANALANG